MLNVSNDGRPGVGPAVGEAVVNPGVGVESVRVKPLSVIGVGPAGADNGDAAGDVATFNQGYIGRD